MSISGMGDSYELPITKKQARALCGMYPLPGIGRETVVALKPDPIYSAFWFRLNVGNYGGVYVATSCNVARDQWPEIFGVTLK